MNGGRNPCFFSIAHLIQYMFCHPSAQRDGSNGEKYYRYYTYVRSYINFRFFLFCTKFHSDVSRAHLTGSEM